MGRDPSFVIRIRARGRGGVGSRPSALLLRLACQTAGYIRYYNISHSTFYTEEKRGAASLHNTPLFVPRKPHFRAPFVLRTSGSVKDKRSSLHRLWLQHILLCRSERPS